MCSNLSNLLSDMDCSWLLFFIILILLLND